MYSASQEKGGLKFHLLHEKDMSPVGYAKVCKTEGVEIPPDEIVRAYEYEKGQYVVVTEEDFGRANARKTKTIEILDFACADEIDSVYFEKPYYLAPDKGADKPYALLLETLRRSNKVGIAKFVLRDRESLGIIKPSGNVLVLNQARFGSEVRDASTLKLPEVEVGSLERELEMAESLVDRMTVPFNPTAYRDTYTEELRRTIESKTNGLTPTEKLEEPAAAEVRDLMAVLKASLEEAPTRAVA